MVVGLFYFTAKTESEVLKMEDNPAETIQVTGFRWSWAFNYENQDVYDIGTPDKDPTVWVPSHVGGRSSRSESASLRR